MKRCKYCDGKGESVCRDCSGTGYASGDKEPCAACQGSGMVDCIYCSGLDNIPLEEEM